ncbi:hypothetical protein CBR_g49619 [Chara braunii]|uniref:Peptidase M16 middle/third domain-containing protein n=1 Tax=Chara braunii TaxID=69332 RepID=A0A388M5E7_CHABU|nr:hypothetical protein CBR_g49619 [Chara braunii]|eukprot:GBG89766.1 hypothetical protein CBR_g49619 [Chara braunii]
MHLAVLGGEDLDTLEKWVQKMFCGISHGPSVPLEAKWEGGSPWERSGVIYRLESVLDTPVLRLIWSVPAKFYGREPTSAVYVAVLLGHEGPGSLAAFLKDLGLVTSLLTWSDDDEHLSTMNLASTLTKKGHEQVLDVIGYCHQYIKMLQDKGPQEWFWKEMKQMAEVHARFEQEAPSVSHVRQSALLLSLYPKEIALVGCSLYMSWKPELIQELLGCLNPSNLLITVSDKTSFGKNAPGVLVEPVYSTSYIIDTVPDDILKEWENPTSVQADFCLPSPNPFIPEEFTLRCLSQTSPPKGERRESLKEDEGEGEGKTGGHNESEGSATNIKAVEEGTSKQTDQVCSESDSNTTTINEAEEGTNVVEQNVQRMATDDTREADGSTYPAGKDDHKDQLAEAIAGTTPAAGGNHDKQPLNKGAELKQGEGQQQDGGKLACWTKVKPEVIYEDDFIKMWHMMDFKVKTPRTTLYLKLSTGQIHRTARGIALLKLFTVILNDALEKELFSASLAGLGFSVQASESYISVIVHGFSHKLPVYAKTLCESLSKVKLEPMRFEAKKDMIVRAYGDLKIDVDDHLVSLRSDLLFTGFSNEEIGEAFATISLEDMRDFIPDMVDQICVEGFAHGNLLAGEALAFVNVLKEALPLHLTRLCERVKTEFYVLKPGVVYLASEPAKNEDEENSVVEGHALPVWRIVPRLSLETMTAWHASLNRFMSSDGFHVHVAVGDVVLLSSSLLMLCMRVTDARRALLPTP